MSRCSSLFDLFAHWLSFFFMSHPCRAQFSLPPIQFELSQNLLNFCFFFAADVLLFTPNICIHGLLRRSNAFQQDARFPPATKRLWHKVREIRERRYDGVFKRVPRPRGLPNVKKAAAFDFCIKEAWLFKLRDALSHEELNEVTYSLLCLCSSHPVPLVTGIGPTSSFSVLCL